MKKRLLTIPLLLCLLLSGCGDRLLERSYSTVVPHSAVYWENEDADTLRAENYQDLVNALLLLLDAHDEDGVVRIYGEQTDKAAMAGRACVEVQKETPIGAYLLDYITYEGSSESGWYELKAHFGYRRTAEEQAAIVNATSTEALPDLLRAAIEEERDSVAIRVGYFGTDREGVMALVAAVHDEIYPPEQSESPFVEGEALPVEETAEAPASDAPAQETEPDPPTAEGEPNSEALSGEEPGTGERPPELPEEPAFDVSPWQVLFYPDTAQPGIVEVILNEAEENEEPDA